MSQHFGDRAGFLAALGREDPERRQAENHARSCAACREALDEGHRLVALLGTALPLPPPTAEALARASAVIEAECSVVRRNRRFVGWAVVGGTAMAWAVQLLLSKRVVHDPSRVAVSLGLLGLTMALARLVPLRGRLAVGAMIGLSGVFAFSVGNVPALEPRIGAECTMYELICAAIPWLCAVVIARRRGVSLGRWGTMAAAAGGALASHAAQHLACPVPHADAHLLLFHFGGVIAAGLLGALNPIPARPAAVHHA